MDRYEFNRQLAAAARAMAEEDGTQHTLDRAVRMATDLIDPCDLADIWLVRPRGIETIAASDAELERLDQLQFELGEGPVLDALRQTDVLAVSDLAHDPRWPHWGPHVARELGVHSSMSFRLFTDADCMGVLNLYSRRVDAFGNDDLLDGLVLAAHASVAVTGTLHEDQLTRALETRRMIGEATGILRERFALTTDQAFGVLRRMSSELNVKLHLIAQQLVDTGALPDRPRRPTGVG